MPDYSNSDCFPSRLAIFGSGVRLGFFLCTPLGGVSDVLEGDTLVLRALSLYFFLQLRNGIWYRQFPYLVLGGV